MSIHLLSWLLSVGGAALFFGIGYVASGIRKGRQGEQTDFPGADEHFRPTEPPAISRTDGAGAELAALRQQLVTEQRARASSEEQLRGVEQVRGQLVRELELIRGELGKKEDETDVGGRDEPVDETVAEAPPVEELSELTQRLEAAQKQLSRLQRDLEGEKLRRQAADRQVRDASKKQLALQRELAQSKKAVADLVAAQEASDDLDSRGETTLVTPPPQAVDDHARVEGFKKQLDAERQRRMNAERKGRTESQKRQALEKELTGVKTALSAQLEAESAQADLPPGDATRVGPVDAAMRADLVAAQHEVDRLRGQLEEAEANEKALELVMEEKAAQAEQLQAVRWELAQLKQAESAQADGPPDAGAQALEQQLATLRQESERQRATAQRREQELQEQVAAVTQELDQLRGERAAAGRRVKELKRFEQASVDLQHVQLELQGLKGEREEQEAKLRDALLKAQLADARATEIERLSEENQRLRAEHRGQEGLDLELATTQKELREAQVAAQVAESRAAEIERLLEENRSLREGLRDMEDMRESMNQLDTVRGENQALRLEADVMARRMQQYEELNAECVDLRVMVAGMTRESEEAKELRQQVQTLEAQLFALGQRPHLLDESSEASLSMDRSIEMAMGGQIGEVMNVLTKAPKLRTAVLADTQGLLVGGVGDRSFHEEIAAWAGVAEGLSSRAQAMLPLGAVRHLTLHDVNELVLFCRFFNLGQDTFILSSLSQKIPPPLDTVESTIEGLAGVLVGGVG